MFPHTNDMYISVDDLREFGYWRFLPAIAFICASCALAVLASMQVAVVVEENWFRYFYLNSIYAWVWGISQVWLVIWLLKYRKKHQVSVKEFKLQALLSVIVIVSCCITLFTIALTTLQTKGEVLIGGVIVKKYDDFSARGGTRYYIETNASNSDAHFTHNVAKDVFFNVGEVGAAAYFSYFKSNFGVVWRWKSSPPAELSPSEQQLYLNEKVTGTVNTQNQVRAILIPR